MTTDLHAHAMRAIADLTGPGGRFELVEEEVLGTTLRVHAHRDLSLRALFEQSVEHGERDYLVTMESRLSYAEHAEQVTALAHALREQYDVQPGDRVAIASANNPGWVLAFWATVSIGAVAVAYNAWWTERELAYGLGHTRPKVLVVDQRRAGLVTPTDGLTVLNVEDDLPRLVAEHRGSALPAATIAEDDPAVIIYTSGTSGRPKGAVHTHRNLLAVVEYHRYNDALLAAFGDPTDPRDRNHLLVMPLFHIGSLHNLVVTRLGTGSKISMHLGAFDVDAIMRLIERERVTNWGAVPTMAKRLLEHGDLGRYDTSSLRAFALASAPSSPQFKDQLRAELPFAASLADSYGLTESCTALAVATPMDLEEAPGTLGRPIIGVELEVRDPMGNALPPGVEGEICARSVYNMLGYWEDPEATAAAIGPDRWLHTGDLGQLDEQGRVRLSTRRSDLIIRGGENVYPAEVEGVVLEHPDVEEALILGVDHDDLGQEVAAVVVRRSTEVDADKLEQQLREHVAASLAYFKVPTHWRITDQALPRNATGKVVRARVQV